MSIGILGVGKMGEALIRGLSRSQGSKAAQGIAGTVRRESAAQELTSRLGIPVGVDNAELVKKSKIIILCVKPRDAESTLDELSSHFTKDHLIVSVCASVRTEDVARWSGRKASVIRAMPNTPCLIGEGMTALAPGEGVKPALVDEVKAIFDTVGLTVEVEEKLMDGVTGLSGCGPAYVYLIIEALSEAGVKVGLPRKTATLLAAQTLAGAARMVLQRSEHPAALKDEVTTPAGCTIDGLMALEEGKIRMTLINAVVAAAERSAKLRSGT
jgi:pyrroline-5-carboxylate reductase